MIWKNQARVEQIWNGKQFSEFEIELAVFEFL